MPFDTGMIAPILNFIVSFASALILHELGHLTAARMCRIPVTQVGLGWGPTILQRKLDGLDCQLRLLPIGAFVRMDMQVLQLRSLYQQLFVLGAGIGVNLMLAILTWGTLFGVLNLGLAVGNCIPLYQQDGWKGAIVLSRKLLGRPNRLVEWTVTIFGGLFALCVVTKAVLNAW
jgi:membrane-associated protease RseP (regulator of RpoE activity)